jgi:hypothetical protein
MYAHLIEVVRHFCRTTLDQNGAAHKVSEFLSADWEERESAVSDPMIRDAVGSPDFYEVAAAWVSDEWVDWEEEVASSRTRKPRLLGRIT